MIIPLPEDTQRYVKKRIKEKFNVTVMFGYIDFYEEELNDLIKDQILREVIEPLEWYNIGKTEYVRVTQDSVTENKTYGLFAWFIGRHWEVVFNFNISKEQLYNQIEKVIYEKYPEELI